MNSELVNLTEHNVSVASDIRSLMSIYLHEPRWLRIFRLFLEVLIAVCGALGNILVCVVITRCIRIKTPIHFYILNLALADLGILFFNFPFAVLKEESPTYWPLGKGVCMYFYPLLDVFYGVSVWSITAIAMERYRTIISVSRIKLRQSSLFRDTTRKSVYRQLVTIWIMSFLIVSLPIFFFVNYNKQYKICYIKYKNYAFEQAYNLNIVIFCYLMPLAIITWTYVYIERSLRRSNNFHKEMNRKVEPSSTCSNEESITLCNTSRLKQNSKVRRILTPVLVVFAVTMLPANIFRLTLTYWSKIMFVKYFYVIYNVCVVLLVLNSASNAFIYTIVSKEFRRSFMNLVSRK